MKAVYSILFIFSSYLLVQCKKPSCLKSNGIIVTVKHIVQPFSQIHVYDNINLILKQEDVESVEVEAGQNIQPNISTVVENDSLIIRNNGSCGWLKSPEQAINVYISFKTLSELQYNGSGKITSTNQINSPSLILYSRDGAGEIDLDINTGYTSVWMQGANVDIKLHGKCVSVNSFVGSRNTIDLSELEATNLNINYTSVRDGMVNVKESITANIWHTGNLYLKGNPKNITTTFQSTGRLIKIP